MDNRCGIAGSVGSRAGEQLHDGWIYPYIARARNYSYCDQPHSGTKTWVNDLKVIIGDIALNKE